ncbi:MAG TPA: hypothetical protein VFT91_09305, partial [Dehalococcoidia bacterium]|nr:hypothetical protein [Dehalococcoidia bacterium]
PTPTPTPTPIPNEADVQTLGAFAGAPAEAIALDPFDVTASVGIRNAGPLGPVNVDTTLTLILPTGCTTSSVNPQVVQDTSLPVGPALLLPGSWWVTCTDGGLKGFAVQADVVIDQAGVDDPDGSNNFAQAEAMTQITVLTCFGLPATQLGTTGSDLIVGTPGPDVIVARDGNDLIFDIGGNDVICAGGGSDVVFAGPGGDVVAGEAGNDVVLGGGGGDLLLGGDDDDAMVGGTGIDICNGGLHTLGDSASGCELVSGVP